MTDGLRITKQDFSGLRRLVRETPDRADQLLRGAATEINTDIVLSFGTSPSREGDPPGVDTGALRASMHTFKDGALRYIVADGVLYGVMLELGTSKMGARPFVSPVFVEWQQRKFSEFIRSFGLIR